MKSREDGLTFARISDYRGQLYAIKIIASSRPDPLREYDQIYMRESDLLVQVQIMAPILAEKVVLFIGDGDSMSISLLYLSSLGYIPAPEHCIVLDFDERILSFLQTFARLHNLHDRLTTELYNVLDPVPAAFVGQADYFYVNPPYGFSNEGRSVIAFLTRCVEGSKPLCSGCIIIPVDADYSPSITVMNNVQCFLEGCGFRISCVLKDMHSYYLDDDPKLRSSTILVERTEVIQPDYYRQKLPESILKCFYGHLSNSMPQYIPQGEDID